MRIDQEEHLLFLKMKEDTTMTNLFKISILLLLYLKIGKQKMTIWKATTILRDMMIDKKIINNNEYKDDIKNSLFMSYKQ